MAAAKKPAAPKRAATKTVAKAAAKAPAKRVASKTSAPKGRPRSSGSPVELQGTGSSTVWNGNYSIPVKWDQYRDTRTGARTRVWQRGDYSPEIGDGKAPTSRANRLAQERQALAQLDKARSPKGGVGNQYEDFMGFDTVGKRNKARPEIGRAHV